MHHHRNAIVLFSTVPTIDRNDRVSPFAGLPWTDIEALRAAMFDDVVEAASLVEYTDVFVYRNQDEMSDDFTEQFLQSVKCRELQGKSFSEQVSHALEEIILEQYSRVIAVLHNHPLIRPALFKKIFDQLKCEDDCVVVGQTADDKIFIFGMKYDHSAIFTKLTEGWVSNSAEFMKMMCALNVMVFPVQPVVPISSVVVALRNNGSSDEAPAVQCVPKRTSAMVALFDRKYKLKRVQK